MAQTLKTTELAPYSFMALMASEGQIPHTTSAPAKPLSASVSLEDRVREIASDITAEGDFLSLMVEKKQMRALPKARPISIKIVRPANLGGDLPTNFQGGAYA